MTALGLFSFFYGLVWGLLSIYALPILMAPIALSLALIIWLLPETNNVNLKLIEKGLFGYIIALICWPNYIAIDLPGLPWLTLLRIIGIPLAILFFISLSMSRDFRLQTMAILRESPLVWKGVAVFSAIAILTTAMSKYPSSSLSQALIAQVNWTAMFLISCVVFAREGSVHKFGIAVWLCTVFVCAIGLWEFYLQRLPWADHLPSFLTIQDETVQAILRGARRFSTGLYRVHSKFGTALGFGEFMAMAAPFVLNLVVIRPNRIVQFGAAATVLLMGFVAYQTDTRLSLIGLLAAGIFFLLYWSLSRWKRNKGSILASLIAMAYPACFMVVIAATVLIGRIRIKVWGGDAHEASNDARITMYEKGIPMVLKNPIGHGFGQGGRTLDFHTPDGFLTIDTYYLAVALEFGILGFIVYYGTFLVGLGRAARLSIDHIDADFAYLGPVAIALTNFIIIKAVYSDMENHPLAFILLGIAVALTYRIAKKSPRVQTPRSVQLVARRS